MRPQGKNAPYMVPLGSSLKFVSNNEFNTTVDSVETVASIIGNGMLLGHVLLGTDGGEIDSPNLDGYSLFTSLYNSDGNAFPIDHGASNSLVTSGLVFNDQTILNNIFSLPFQDALVVQNKATTRAIGATPLPLGSPKNLNNTELAARATVIYATQLAPYRAGNINEAFLADFNSVANTYQTLVNITGQGGQLMAHSIMNDAGATAAGAEGGIDKTWVKYTFDGTVIEIDMSVDTLPRIMMTQNPFANTRDHWWAFNPFPLRFENSLMIEIKDDVTLPAAGKDAISKCHYTLDL